MNIEEDKLISLFLKNKLSETEVKYFFKKLDSNSLFKEKFILEQQLFETFDEKNWSFVKNLDNPEIKKYEALFKNEDAIKIKKSISIANKNYKNKKVFRFKKWYMYSSAAVIAILISLIAFNYQTKTSEEIYSNYIDKVNLPSFKDRSDENQFKKLIIAQNNFENKEFSKAANVFDQELRNNPNNSNIYLYLAISQMELNQFKESEKTLNSLINKNLIDSEKGYWFKTLLYIKSKQVKKAKSTLNLIIKHSYYNHIKSKELLIIISNL